MMGKFGELIEILRGLDGVWDASGGHDAGDAGEESGAPEKMTMRVLCLKALELLVRRSRREGDRRELLSEEQLEKVLLDPSDNNVGDEQDGDVDLCTAISLLESLSTSALALAWPETLLHRLSALFPRLATAGMETSPSLPASPQPRHEHLPQQQQQEQQRILFLLYRLTLNLTTDHPRNCSFFATRETFYALLSSIYASFLALDAPLSSSSSNLTTNSDPQQQQSSPSPPPSRALTLDLLILALGIAINLTTTDSSDHDITTSATSLLLPLLIDPKDPLSALFARLIGVFRSGRVRIDRELDSPPPEEGGKGHTARGVVEGEGLSAGGNGGGREREVFRREGQGQQGRGDEEEGEDGEEGDVGFNIAWGYLAVFLGKCCSFPSPSSQANAGIGGKEIRHFVASHLHPDVQAGAGQSGSAMGAQQQQQRGNKRKKDGRGERSSGRQEGGGGLEILVQAVEEFVVYHQRVDRMMMNNSSSGVVKGSHEGSAAGKGDMMDEEDGLMSGGGRGGEKDEQETFAGQEGKEVWSAFTEKLRLVLERLKRVVKEDVG
ncbi:hypothetical protein KC332_g1244 [Hortaea werneckii]|nr:hypothetical protein KC350_g7741 [Hortaea werneckii]KAI6847461.1 hypothetical protein KC358_g2333 [Hortaea werneckii]KAI6902010.1 hypothetical protein KC348_g16248 [Hortaea werneckii]KAI6967968.1 hypothetical protein KC321_g8730 [Hortaea werneckii]KAI6993002.1 hypothetical protein KC329_g3468 [Hortaea werneckii]